MGAIVLLLAIIVFLTGIVTFIFYKLKPKFLWLVPFIALITSGCLFLNDISLIASEPTFSRKLALYFHNDWSMGFYFVYLPITGIAVIVTVIAYLLNNYKGKPNKKT